MSVIIKIHGEQEIGGEVRVEIHGEHTRPSRAARLSDLIIAAVRDEFQPVKKKRETLLFEEKRL